MIIRGGQVFVMEEDILPKVSITGATIITECSDASLEGQTAFVSERVGRGSEINSCTLIPIERWAKGKANEGISRAKSDLHLAQAPIMQRIRKFLRLEAAS